MTWLGKPLTRDLSAPPAVAVQQPLSFPQFPGPENIEFLEPMSAEERARQDLKVEVIAASLPKRWNAKKAAKVLYTYRRLWVKQPPGQIRNGFEDVLRVKDQVAFVELCFAEFNGVSDRLRLLLEHALK